MSDMLARHVPTTIGRVRAQRPLGRSVTSAVTRPTCAAFATSRIDGADFSRDVHQHASDLGVVAMTDSGWDDWGTPERVLRSLDGPRGRELRELLGASRGNAAAARRPSTSASRPRALPDAEAAA